MSNFVRRHRLLSPARLPTDTDAAEATTALIGADHAKIEVNDREGLAALLNLIGEPHTAPSAVASAVVVDRAFVSRDFDLSEIPALLLREAAERDAISRRARCRTEARAVMNILTPTAADPNERAVGTALRLWNRWAKAFHSLIVLPTLHKRLEAIEWLVFTLHDFPPPDEAADIVRTELMRWGLQLHYEGVV